MQPSPAENSKPIQRVMLIDDDTTDNFLHARVLEKSGYVEHIVAFEHAEDAIEYLSSSDCAVDLVCLDINMPRMNGFEFLEVFQDLRIAGKTDALILIISTSISPEVARQARGFSAVVRTDSKPLTHQVIELLVTEHFNAGKETGKGS